MGVWKTVALNLLGVALLGVIFMGGFILGAGISYSEPFFIFIGALIMIVGAVYHFKLKRKIYKK